VQNRRYTDPESADDVGQLDADAIASVRDEAWPQPRNADEMHEALGMLGAVSDDEVAAQADWKKWLTALAKAGRATRLLLDGKGRSARGLWVAAERLPLLQAIAPDAPMQPAITAPDDAERPDDRDAALREVLRSRLGGLGPVTVAQLASPLCLPVADVEAALLALQAEGSVLQGRFTPGTDSIEWCERHLLARIHRYTLKRLRREIEPVEPRDFVRFLFEWQHVGAASRVSGPEALSGVLSQLEGYEAPAPLWEAEVLPARVTDYAGAWLDDLCTAGRVLWTRLRPNAVSATEGRKGAGSLSLRATPVVLLPRRSAALWTALAPAPIDDDHLGSRASRVAEHLKQHGACFFDEIAGGTRLLPVEIEEALTELVAKGRVRCDSYAGLRALLVPASKRASADTRRRRRVPLFGIEDAGRWTLVRPPSVNDAANPGSAEAIEQVVHVLLRRYGVICWRLLEREPAWLPPWRDLVRVCRRLEARGEIRGGRFIAGVSGEQFALPEAVASMRRVRREPHDGAFIALAASDPANLLGTIVNGPKVPRVAGSRVLWRDGVPIATSIAGEIAMIEPLDAAEAQAARRALALDPSSRLFDSVVAQALGT